MSAVHKGRYCDEPIDVGYWFSRFDSISSRVCPQAALFVSFLLEPWLLSDTPCLAHRITLGIRWMFKRVGAGFSRLL